MPTFTFVLRATGRGVGILPAAIFCHGVQDGARSTSTFSGRPSQAVGEDGVTVIVNSRTNYREGLLRNFVRL